MNHAFGIVGVPKRGIHQYIVAPPNARLIPNHPLTQNLVSLWRLNETTGTLAKDTLQKYNMSIVGGVTPSICQRGPSFLFNGSTGQLTNNNAILTGAPMTVCAWVRCDNLGDRSVFTIGDTAGTADSYALEISSTDDAVVWFARRSSTAAARSSSPLVQGRAHFVAGIEYTNASRAAFLDGGNKGVNTDSRIPVSLDTTAIGVRKRSTDSQFWPGVIYQVSIYNRALMDDEIRLLYEQPNVIFWIPKQRIIFPAVEGGQEFNLSVSDSFVIGDNLSVGSEIYRTFVDSFSVGDNLSISSQVSRSFSDSFFIGDDLSISSQVTRSFSDSFTVGDNLSISSEIYRSFSEGVFFSDQVSMLLNPGAQEFTQSVADSFTLSDLVSIIYTPGASQYTQSINDSFVVNDTNEVLMTYNRFWTDSISVDENLSIASDIYRSRDETLNVNDQVNITSQIYRSFGDSFTISDSVSMITISPFQPYIYLKNPKYVTSTTRKTSIGSTTRIVEAQSNTKGTRIS